MASLRLFAAAGLAALALRGAEGCTAVAVDGRASPDGSAFAGMNADCQHCDSRLAYIPAREHPEGATRPLYFTKLAAPRFVGPGRGRIFEPQQGQDPSPQLGEIPEVKRTFAYWESILPLMNEKGLSLGESSSLTRLMNYPKGMAPSGGDPRSGGPATEGVLDLRSMMQIALERCATARCAVQLMGKLSEEYGFYPMVNEWSLGREPDNKTAFDEGGEALTLADSTGEAWVFHVIGGVPGVTRSVWAAMRLPPGHAAVVANFFTLGDMPREQSEDWLFSEGIREAARRAGLWDGREPLNFARAFSPDWVTFESPAGVAPKPLYASLRLWRFYGLMAPYTYGQRSLRVDPRDYPTSVAAERPVGRAAVFGVLSDLFEGTEFDFTQGALAGPFGNPFRLDRGPAIDHLGQVPRGFSLARTAYSVVGESRPQAEPLLWFAPDTPVSSVYVPFYPAAGGGHAPAYAAGTLDRFSRDSAFWAFDFVANWASMANWRNASGEFIYPLKAQLQGQIYEQMPHVEERARREGRGVLAEWQARVQQRVVDRWWRLADELLVVYNDGYYNDIRTNRMGLDLGYPDWWAKQIGFDQDVHPIFVRRDGGAEARYLADASLTPPGFYPTENPLPGSWDFRALTWLYAPVRGAALAAAQPSGALATCAYHGLAAACALSLGVLAGRTYERRKRQASLASYQPLP